MAIKNSFVSGHNEDHIEIAVVEDVGKWTSSEM